MFDTCQLFTTSQPAPTMISAQRTTSQPRPTPYTRVERDCSVHIQGGFVLNLEEMTNLVREVGIEKECEGTGTVYEWTSRFNEKSRQDHTQNPVYVREVCKPSTLDTGGSDTEAHFFFRLFDSYKHDKPSARAEAVASLLARYSKTTRQL